MRLPGTVFCFHPEADYPYPEYGTRHLVRPLTFGSFNNAPKLTPRTVALWAAVLKAVPGSRLLLKAPSFKDGGAVTAFKTRFAAHGIAASRLEFRGPVGLTDMMAEYEDVDIALDPVPYNGGTTTLQALWMGVPVVVLAGQHFVSRMGASFMTAAGLPEWVAKDDEDYVAIATKMAKDRKGLLKLKQGLRKRLQNNPAWDPVAHTAGLDAAARLACLAQLHAAVSLAHAHLVALLGRLHPVGVLVAAIFFAVLSIGAQSMHSVYGLPIALAQMVQALVVLFVLVADALARRKST
jgi:hypothetical protein